MLSGECAEVLKTECGDREPVGPQALNAQLAVLPRGFVYAASAVTGTPTKRNAGVVLISGDETPLEVSIIGTENYQAKRLRGRTIAIAPGVTRSLKTGPSGCLSIHFDPAHQTFLAMAKGLEKRGGCRLGSKWLIGLEADLQNCQYDMDAHAIFRVFDQTVKAVSAYCPQTISRDYRIEALLKKLQHLSPLDYNHGDILKLLNLSPSRVSHLFSEHAGLSLRSFLLWKKIKEAMMLFETRATMTEIAHASGFTDSAHFCRTFMSSLGLRPSMFGPDREVKVRVLKKLDTIPEIEQVPAYG